ncbi:hypothetical protein BC351_10730 [Paenibacillus ferrarius]|uniref:Uncharacterized protein n=1 Tax=Paenibacillus ferrarius TaxID=1469647 RepID=A0A1V4H972_9BACL|nr:hypothetical protein [Paenibacillus ferrarius]OPH47656.1 hypothetical protein BC351_10730 [Paenibacillus ferrarius]
MESKQIVIGDDTYEWTVENGQDVLRQYDEEFKMWVKLKFSTKSTDINSIITNILTSEFISKTAH